MGKGHESTAEQYIIRHGEDFFRLDGHFATGKTEQDRIVIKLEKRKRKVIERNGVAYERIAEHVGRYPVVIVVPDDVALVQEGSETRRRLLDNSLSQTDPAYLARLITYNKLLAQRNALLKQYNGQSIPAGLLEVYDQQMAEPAAFIHRARADFITPFTASLREVYANISDRGEDISITYRSQLNEFEWATLLGERREKDRILQRTTGGIHRDDLIFTQGGYPLRREASQGQLKTFVLSVKLAQYELLQQQTQRPPILLLDDIFDKLDRGRVGRLLDLILKENYGQVFLSDTDANRIATLIDGGEYRRYYIRSGQASEEEEE